MTIHVVQPGETIYSIAETYGITVERLLLENDLINPYDLVTGQTIIITYPEQTYTVEEGDTLEGIMEMFGVPRMQLLRNNPQLLERDYLIIGETLVISYKTIRQITTDGFAYPFINKNALKKTLPYLTYLSIFNYSLTSGGNLISYYEDKEIIEMAKSFGVAPLMMASAFSIQGEPNLPTVYDILLNMQIQELIIDNILIIIKEKGYYGLNITFSYLNLNNERLYLNFLEKLSKRLKAEEYLLFVTVNPNISYYMNQVNFERIDYTKFSDLVDNFTFFSLIWSSNSGPPAPVSSSYSMRVFLDYVTQMIQGNKINIGTPVIGYDWQLPYIAGVTTANTLTLNSALSLAHDVGAVILFDEISQTPYFQYMLQSFGMPIHHIVWFIDARTINALSNVVVDYELSGTGIWNIMIYIGQMWTVINSQYEIIKVIPESESIT